MNAELKEAAAKRTTTISERNIGDIYRTKCWTEDDVLIICESHEKLRMDLRHSEEVAKALAAGILDAAASIERILSEQTNRGREILGYLKKTSDVPPVV